MNIEKKLKNHFSSLLKHEDKLDSIKAKANLTKSEPWYKRKAILFPGLGVLSAGAAMAVIFTVIGANNTQISDSANVKSAIMKLDLNPSIVISINDEGNVNSIYGANDDGKIVTVSENYIGQNYWTVVKDVLSTEKDTGYFILNKENVDYNKFYVTIYSSDGAYANNFKKQVVSYLNSEDILVSDDDVTTTDSTEYTDLDTSDDDSLTIEEGDSFDEIQSEIDSYYQEASDYATKVLEEFHDFAVSYGDKANYLESAIDTLKSEGIECSFYENKVNRLQEKITGYISLYSQIFVDDNCSYMNKYKELIDKKIEVLTKRNELLKEEVGEEVINALNAYDDELDAIIANLDTFRLQMLESIKNRLDSLLSTLDEFNTWIESEDFRKAISNNSFNNIYRSRQLAYIDSFKTNYSSSFLSWKNILVNAKNNLKANIGNVHK